MYNRNLARIEFSPELEPLLKVLANKAKNAHTAILYKYIPIEDLEGTELLDLLSNSQMVKNNKDEFFNSVLNKEWSEKIKNLLQDKNKVLKNKIDFGISINCGSIVAKQEPDSFKFMPMGNLMTLSKKIASAAEKEIFMSTRMADLVRANVRAEKHVRDGTDVYLLKDIKDSGEHEKFLKGFMKRQEK